MGTINYGTSDYITIGYNCNDIDYEEYEWSVETIEEYYITVEQILKEYSFYYFHVVVKSGYYEGFYIDIENNFKYCFDTSADKRAAQKEITQIKAFLLECVNNCECCAVSPGWCTTYYNYTDTLTRINDAINEMRADVLSTPTWATLPANEKYAY